MQGQQKKRGTFTPRPLIQIRHQSSRWIPGTQQLAELSGKIGGDKGSSATAYEIEVQDGRVCLWV